MSALMKITNLDELREELEKIAYSLDSIASTLAYIARRMEKEESE